MPWQEVSIMEQREEFVRLARLEGVNRRELCRRFGISAQTGYKWLHRFAAGEALEDRSRRPKSSPRRVERSLEEAVIGVRKAHPAWGARKIAAVLARSHESLPAVSTIHAVLCRHGLVVPREATGQVWNRFEQDAANRLWQMDFKGRVRLGDAQPCHPLTIVDDHSRFAVCLAACLDQRTRTVQHQLERSFARYGLPDAFLVDNGSPWGSSHPDSRWTPLRVWLARLGVNMIYARPFHPQTKGKNERFNRTLNEEVLALRSYRDSAALQQAFDRWRLVYNHHRPHEALADQVPASRYRPSQRNWPDSVPDVAYEPGTITRLVPRTKAYISYKGRLWPVPKAFRGYRLAIRPTATDGILGIYFAANRVANIDLTTL
jgi:transposase InsO family protein